MSQPTKSRLSRAYYPAAHDSGYRSASDIKWIVLHSTEGDTARGAASWFRNPASQGSAHIAVDGDEGYRCVDDLKIAWGASGANTNGLHMEHAARAAWLVNAWKSRKNRRMLRRSAWHVAKWCKKYNIPARYIGVRELRTGGRGITFHYSVSEAFHASSHWDPGKGFPKRLFLRLVKRYLRELT